MTQEERERERFLYYRQARMAIAAMASFGLFLMLLGTFFLVPTVFAALTGWCIGRSIEFHRERKALVDAGS